MWNLCCSSGATTATVLGLYTRREKPLRCAWTSPCGGGGWSSWICGRLSAAAAVRCHILYRRTDDRETSYRSPSSSAVYIHIHGMHNKGLSSLLTGSFIIIIIGIYIYTTKLVCLCISSCIFYFFRGKSTAQRFAGRRKTVGTCACAADNKSRGGERLAPNRSNISILQNRARFSRPFIFFFSFCLNQY